MITKQQLHILRHSLGLDDNGHGRSYRNYFCTGPECDSYQDCEALKEMGFMMCGQVMDKNHFYHVTLAGEGEALRDVVRPVLGASQRRYQKFLELDSGMTFKQFLTNKLYKEMHR
jgi:hypothetical protein